MERTDRTKLHLFRGNNLAKTWEGHGRKESFPFILALVTMFTFIHHSYEESFEDYIFHKKSQESGHCSIERLLQRTADRTYSVAGMYNVDETAIRFDLPLHRIWGIKGEPDCSPFAGSQ
ncbi:hypothetical protein PHPALM_7739 [Phytophthora palmivora]|uniref:Uncharacterized protein n=1 Tax=Phytophthora palmivora TaxID=4796 RepID=A0A2P4YBK5_9STRA|nr:hypothetical protein PHPALM_7739 [Phytophthora palmivora]